MRNSIQIRALVSMQRVLGMEAAGLVISQEIDQAHHDDDVMPFKGEGLLGIPGFGDK
jgi:hypothetical protein